MCYIYTRTKLIFTIIILINFKNFLHANTSPKEIVSKQTQIRLLNQKSQLKINSLDEKTKELLEEYKNLTEEIENTRSYNDQLRKVIKSQELDVKSIMKQISSIEITNKRIIPLLVKMLDSLKEFIKLDTPFLLKERTRRVNVLTKMLNSADVSNSEKYRRIMRPIRSKMNTGEP